MPAAVPCRRFFKGLSAVALAAGLVLAGAALPGAAAEGPRIVSVGGSVTEILAALGQSQAIVAVDSTSSYPPEMAAKPVVGYMRALSAEGVLSVSPDLVIAEADAGPPPAMEVLKAAVKVVTIEGAPSPEGVAAKIRAVGAAVGKEAEAAALASRTEAAFATLGKDVAAITERRRVLFVLSAAGGRIMAGGQNSSADAIIRLAGGINAADGFDGFKPMTDEAIIAAAPDVVVVMNRGDHAISPDMLFALPAFQSTPAAASRALIAMDGLYLIGFGPRAPDAARDLAARLYPEKIAAVAGQ